MWFDAHIHLEQYSDEEIDAFCRHPRIVGLAAVSMDLASSKRTLELKRKYPDKVKVGCGYHPEQPPHDLRPLIAWMDEHQDEIDALGEVGLPYYRRREAKDKGHLWDEEPYLEMLHQLFAWAKQWGKPVLLHGVREDVDTLASLLKEYHMEKSPFSLDQGGSVAIEAARGGWVFHLFHSRPFV